MYKAEERSPGPGAYNPNIRPVLPSPPAYTLASKRRQPPAEDWKLGPGMYHPRYGPSGPAYSLLGKGKSDLNREKVWLLERARVPSPRGVTNTWSPKRFLLSEVTPGPGTYNIPSGSRGPAFSVTSKRRTKDETDAPGPGTYFYTTRPTSLSYSMYPRFPPPRTVQPLAKTVYGEFCNSPGPAQYHPDISKLKRGPAFTIPGKWHPGRDSGLPGPGTYFPPQNNTFGQAIRCQHRPKVREFR